MATEARLTELTTRGGCACKLEAGRLDELLGGRAGVDLRRLGDAHAFAAGDIRLVGSVDLGTPVVDDPSNWGEITVANALSDVYAVGGTPLFAVSVLGWPDNLPLDAPTAALEAAAELLHRESIVFGGGHSITAAEPLLGFAVIGKPPDVAMSVASFAPGDELWLTKRLGNGLILGAARFELALPEAQVDAALDTARSLNRDAAAAAVAVDALAATDVSGYGLLGACREAAVQSGVALELERAAIPWLEGVDNVVEAQAMPRRADETWRWLDCQELISGARDTRFEMLAAAPETSGGLLVGLRSEAASRFADALAVAGVTAARVGSIRAGEPTIRLI